MLNHPSNQTSSTTNPALNGMATDQEPLPRILEYTPKAAKQRLKLIHLDWLPHIEGLLVESAHLGEGIGYTDEVSGLELMTLTIAKWTFFFTFKERQVVRVTLIKATDDLGDDDDPPPAGGLPRWVWAALSLVVRVLVGRWLDHKFVPGSPRNDGAPYHADGREISMVLNSTRRITAASHRAMFVDRSFSHFMASCLTGMQVARNGRWSSSSSRLCCSPTTLQKDIPKNIEHEIDFACIDRHWDPVQPYVQSKSSIGGEFEVSAQNVQTVRSYLAADAECSPPIVSRVSLPRASRSVLLVV